MSDLLQRQFIFTINVAKLIMYINSAGYHCKGGEWERPEETALAYAKKGIGSKNSLHKKALAIDIRIFKDNNYLTDTELYTFAGTYWMSLHPDNRWGGVGGEDGNHFSMIDAPGRKGY